MSDENKLMFQVQAGELDKLATLYENNKIALFNYFVRSGQNKALSEDLVQETFMRILASRSTFQGSSSFKSWMYSIARNTVADHFRRAGNKQQYEDIDHHEFSGNGCLSEQMSEKQQQDMFNQSLANIEPEHRDIILLSRFQQLNYQDIAQLLGCNLNTLKARMRKAVSVLQESYQALTKEVSS